MTAETFHNTQQRALEAFQRDLPALWAEHPGLWVAYKGEKRLCLGNSKHRLYQECFEAGLQRDDFVVFCIEPQETEMTLGPVALD